MPAAETLHVSHVTRRISDASSFDEICVNCGSTDQVLGGWGRLALPCPNPVGSGGKTLKEYYADLEDRHAKAQANQGG